MRRLNKTQRTERAALRVTFFGGLATVLAFFFLLSSFTSALFSSSSLLSETGNSQSTSLNIYIKKPSTVERAPNSHRRQLDLAEQTELSLECFENFPAECPSSTACVGDAEREGACCFTDNIDLINNATCITREKELCGFKDLCVAELVPGSGIGAECLKDFETNGGAAMYFLLLLYLFLALAIVCDDYFTYSLDMLAELLQISSDIKGATFAAIGSSAPELFVSLADNVITNPPKSVGVGTIVGSAIFNILVIIGLSGIWAGFREDKLVKQAKRAQRKEHFSDEELARRILKAETFLDWRPLARDSVFYVISILALVFTAITGDEALFYEGLILMLLYMGYLVFMKFNHRFFAWLDTKLGLKTRVEEKIESKKEIESGKSKDKDLEKFAQLDGTETPSKSKTGVPVVVSDREITTLNSIEAEEADEDDVPVTASGREIMPRHRRSSVALMLSQGNAKLMDEEDMSNEAYFECLYWPMYDPNKKIINDDESVSLSVAAKQDEAPKIQISFVHALLGGGRLLWQQRAYYLLVLPINLVFRLTIPDARWDLFGEDTKGNKRKRKIGYWSEFLLCVLHIALLSHFLVFSAAKFGCLVGVPPSVMGLTVLAAGTSVPDAITSVILTKNGEGDAAVANSIGSNVFDILIGLGLPWFLAGLIFGQAEIATGDISISIIFLFGVLVVLLVALVLTKFRLNRYLGVALVLIYLFYVIFELFIREKVT